MIPFLGMKVITGRNLRDIASTDGERVAAELKEFEQVGIEYQKELARLVLDRGSGWVRLSVKITDGRLEMAQNLTEQTRKFGEAQAGKP